MSNICVNLKKILFFDVLYDIVATREKTNKYIEFITLISIKKHYLYYTEHYTIMPFWPVFGQGGLPHGTDSSTKQTLCMYVCMYIALVWLNMT